MSGQRTAVEEMKAAGISWENRVRWRCFVDGLCSGGANWLKAGVNMKMSGKTDFLFSLELASSTIGLHIGKSCFGVF